MTVAGTGIFDKGLPPGPRLIPAWITPAEAAALVALFDAGAWKGEFRRRLPLTRTFRTMRFG